MTVHQKQRSIAVGFGIALSSMLAFGASSRADVIDDAYGGPTSFNYEIIGMPDFDQKRIPGGFDPLGLPGGGSMYCMPTATLNMMAYAARHGFPSLSPGIGNWNSPGMYYPITLALRDMGDLMDTDPEDGTGSGDWHDGTVDWAAGQPITVHSYSAHGNWAPSIDDLALMAVQGKLVSFLYGRYVFLGESDGITWVLGRTGGHCVTLVKAQRSGSTIVIGARDPAQVPVGDTNESTQSTFSTRLLPEAAQKTVFRFNGSWERSMTALAPAGDTIALIDNVTMISPMYGLSFENYEIPLIVQHLSANFFSFSEQAWALAEGTIRDLAPRPDSTRYEYVHWADHLNPDTASIRSLNPVTGETTVIENISGAAALAFGRMRELYVLTRSIPGGDVNNSILCLDVDADTPVTASINLPSEAIGIVYQDVDDRVAVVSSVERKIRRYAAGLPPTVPVDQLFIPTNVPMGPGGLVAVNPVTNGIWFWTTGDTSTVYNVEPVAGAPPMINTATLPVGIPFIYSLAFDDRGRMFVGANDGVIELVEEAPGQWVETTSPYFDDVSLPLGSRMAVTRSRTNYDPAVHGGPEWFNIDPDDLEDFGESIPDCTGDVDGDRYVGVSDLLLVLAEWGACDVCSAADIDESRSIDVSDMLLLLAAWGSCD